ERTVDLDDMNVRDPGREVFGQHPQPAADLEDHIGRIELRRAPDHAEDVVVDQEVLAELAVRAYPELAQPAQAGLARPGAPPRPLAHHPKTRAAFRSTIASSSAYDVPRSSATYSAVCTTLAG